MHIALIAANCPRTHVLQLLAAILNARVVAALLDLGIQFKVLDGAAAPDQKLVVRQRLIALRDARDAAVLNRPGGRIAFPAGQIFAVEEISFLGLPPSTCR